MAVAIGAMKSSTRRADSVGPGRFGTADYTDPAEGMIGILFTQCVMNSTGPPKALRRPFSIASVHFATTTSARSATNY
jgi:hypothetical protein